MLRASFLWRSIAPLSAPAVTQALQELPGWRRNGMQPNVIERDFFFSDFREAMAFMNSVADTCEEEQHHPFWINVYNRVTVRFTTHDAGNMVTEKDIKMAHAFSKAFDELAKKR